MFILLFLEGVSGVSPLEVQNILKIFHAFCVFYQLFIVIYYHLFLNFRGPDCYPKNLLESFLHFTTYLIIF